jgi:hypothetical protein
VSWPRPFDRSVNRDQLRRRILAFGGLWFLLAGMLAALGFGIVLLVSLALVLVGGVLAGGVWLARRYRVRQGLRTAVRSTARTFRDLKARLDELGLQQHLLRFTTRSRRTAITASHRARGFLALSARSCASVIDRSRRRASQALRKEPTAVDRQRHALRLNELGAELRRSGNHQEAAEQHRAALAILRELGDRRAEALTLNNLALALVHTTGGVALAVQHFEEALVVLQELGDEEHEGQVIANLGFVRRRQGRDEDAENLLHAALDKLPPESSAYRQVEEQLRRAS